jgi:hypothetical protein
MATPKDCDPGSGDADIVKDGQERVKVQPT